jgi:UDP-N-acetylglucosamine 1-carboxyvinyltransferase
MLELLNSMGSNIRFEEDDGIEIDSSSIANPEARYELVKTMRASVLVMGPLLAKYGKAKISQPGGCNIGSRPIDFHLAGLQQMGANITTDSKFIYLEAKRLKATHFKFPKISVTGTENLIMASIYCDGTTTLENCAREPEVEDLINFLNSSGAKISRTDDSTIIIEGVNTLNQTKWTILPDRIEAGTYLVAGAITNGHVKVNGIQPSLLEPIIEKFREMGAVINTGQHYVEIDATLTDLKSCNINTEPFPGFPTDMQAQFMALNAISKGTSIIVENVFENRFQHVVELKKMGADISLNGSSAVISGVANLVGSSVIASDLRASASLVLAGLVGKNRTEIEDIFHIDRGYECIEEKLNKLGAEIIREPIV